MFDIEERKSMSKKELLSLDSHEAYLMISDVLWKESFNNSQLLFSLGRTLV